MTEHPRMRLIDVYANLLQGYRHAPTLRAKLVSVRDGLPKYRDLPGTSAAPARRLPTSLPA
jgi:hypothetical protein